ncbi:transmembrane protein sting [Glossina fuscipes fuscipes]
MLGTYIDDCLNIMHIVVLGEISWRLICAAKEYFIYYYHYEVPGRLWQILKRSFSTKSTAQPYLLLIVCGTLCRCSMTLRLSWPALRFLPLYFLYRGLDISFSNLQYAYWIRGSHGLDYAEGMASNYFHGYLKLALPSHNEGEGIKQRIALYESQEGVKFILNRLVILVPSTMFVNSKIESSILTRDGIKPLDTIVKNRAGVARPFKNNVYRFTKPINGTYYYVALEGATPLLSFFEAMHHRTSMTRQMVEMKREILLKFYHHLKKLLNEWPETRHQAELILYNSSYDDGYSQDIGEVVLAHIANMEQKT